MRYLILVLIIISVTPVYGAPSASLNAGTLTISGSGFGTKPVVTPIRYDDFAGATVGNTMAQATSNWWTDTSRAMTITNNNPRYSGNKSANALSAGTSKGNSSAYPYSADQQAYRDNIGFKDTKKFYINYWWYFDAGATPANFSDAVGTQYWQIKSTRLLADVIGGSFNGVNYPSFFVDTQNFRTVSNPYGHDYAGTRYYQLADIQPAYLSDNTWYTPGWYNVQVYGQMDSSIGAGDGSYFISSSKANFGSPIETVSKTNIQMINATNPNGNAYYNAVFWDNYLGNLPDPPAYNPAKSGGYALNYLVTYGGVYYKCKLAHDPPQLPTNTTYWDVDPYGYQVSTNLQYSNIYIDNSWARVELCDSSVWASRTHCEIQPATAWSDGSITATYNAGSFTNGQMVYAFITTEAGTQSTPSNAVVITNGALDSATPTTTSNKSGRITKQGSTPIDKLVTLQSSDNVGVTATSYCLTATKGGTCTPDTPYTVPFACGQNIANCDYCVSSTDAANNTEPAHCYHAEYKLRIR